MQRAQQLAEWEAWAQPGLALRPEEPAVQDAAEVPVAVWAAAEVRPRAAELPGAAAVPQREVRDAVAGRRPAELAVQDAAVLQPEVPDERAAALPLAAAWVFRRDQVLPWLEP